MYLSLPIDFDYYYTSIHKDTSIENRMNVNKIM